MLETVYVGDNFEMFMADSLHWSHQHEESHQYNDSATSILKPNESRLQIRDTNRSVRC